MFSMTSFTVKRTVGLLVYAPYVAFVVVCIFPVREKNRSAFFQCGKKQVTAHIVTEPLLYSELKP